MALEFKQTAFSAGSNSKAQHLDVGTQASAREFTTERQSLFNSIKNGQDLAGTGALVFEGEILEIPVWN